MKKSLHIILFCMAIVVFFTKTGKTQETIVADSIRIVGNKSTKDYIILRELTFHHGDTLAANTWGEIKTKCEENLINTSLFHTATIDTIHENNSLHIQITVAERWYIFPIPFYEVDERNFNSWLKSDKISRASAGFFFMHSNFRGRMEIFQLIFELGYNKKLGFAYSIPYINKKKTIGIAVQSIYTSQHEVNINTFDNKQVYLKLRNNPIQQSLSSFVQISWRPNIYGTYQFQIGHDRYMFADSLVKENTLYSNGGLKKLDYLSATLKIKNDHRNYKSYPLQGHYEDLEIKYHGVGLIDNNKLNVLYLKANFRKYLKLNNRFYYAIGLAGKLSNNAFQPFVIAEGLGYSRDFVRGYEYYVIDGQNYGVVKHNIKYNLMKTRYVNLKFLRWKKFNKIPFTFYTNLFSDAGYCRNHQSFDPSNNLTNKWLYSYGIGIDMVSYYDSVMRFEYTINRMGERGIYLHMIAPI